MNVVTTAPELDEASLYRETLVHAARHLALSRDDIVRLAEALNHRPWNDCRAEEIAVVRTAHSRPTAPSTCSFQQ